MKRMISIYNLLTKTFIIALFAMTIFVLLNDLLFNKIVSINDFINPIIISCLFPIMLYPLWLSIHNYLLKNDTTYHVEFYDENNLPKIGLFCYCYFTA